MPLDSPTGPYGREDFAAIVEAVKTAIAEAVSVPQLLTATEAMKYIGLSKSGWHRARSAGKLPAPIYVDGSGEKWRKTDLDIWLSRLRPLRRSRARK